MQQLTLEQMVNIEPFFAFVTDTVAAACIQGYMGQAWADDPDNPRCAKIFTADFCFTSGDASAPEAELMMKHLPEHYRKPIFFLVPQDESWGRLAQQVWGEKCRKVIRYALKNDAVFDQYHLRSLVSGLPEGLELCRINREIYHQAFLQDWSSDFCGNFNGEQDFLNRGLGVVIRKDGELIAGASSYSVCNGALEVEIAVSKDYRRRGLATICGAKLILEALKKSWYPSWDAANMESVKTAEKLGYQFDCQYDAYEITI